MLDLRFHFFLVKLPTSHPTTTLPKSFCSVVTSYVNITDDKGCSGLVEKTRCIGACNSDADIYYFTPPYVRQECACCIPLDLVILKTRMTCPGYSYTHPYTVIRGCNCITCGKDPLAWKKKRLHEEVNIGRSRQTHH